MKQSLSNCHRVHISKQTLKFASAHMTVFPDGTKETLHGHNYSSRVVVELADISLKSLISFAYFKKIMKGICDQWDEKVLIADQCPFMSVVKPSSPTEYEFLLCSKRYVLPREDVAVLPLDNITAESLSEEFCRLLVAGLDPQLLGHHAIRSIEVFIEESPGQGASFLWTAGGRA